MDFTVNKSRATFVTSEILSFAFLIGRATFFTCGILSFVFCSTEVPQNLTFDGQKFADKS